MATRDQRRKERKRAKRAQKKKEKEQQKQPVSSGRTITVPRNTTQQRISRQQPQAWEGELREDVAVFDDAACESLDEKTRSQIQMIRQALETVCNSKGADANQLVSSIPRSSQLSEWRLFVRGFSDWMNEDTTTAREVWSRLDPERRPGRIAAALISALRADLEKQNPSNENDAEADSASEIWHPQPDETLTYHAKLVRRVRFDRAAIRLAETGVRARDEEPNLKIGSKKLRWLKNFAQEYAATEPYLVEALQNVALGRAYSQNYIDVFEEAVETLPGPRHDPKHRLLYFFFYAGDDPDSPYKKQAERALKQYLEKDLPNNKQLSKTMRDAIKSQIHLNEALTEIVPISPSPFGSFLSPEEDKTVIRKHLREAVKSYPANRKAHQTYVVWIQGQLDQDRLTKAAKKSLNAELVKVNQAWSAGLPDDIEPRLWLVDQLLEDEEMELAKPHVDWLVASRQPDPRVRATPWKWQILEAMRLCRRKKWLAEVPEKLNEAESLWPAWLSKRWLPYLRAALLLREGRKEDYEKQRQQICETTSIDRDSLDDACMMLGAAQRMRVPSADLKPLREPIDAGTRELDTLSLDELIRAGAFFWDLIRTQLLYPAYRMHSKKFAQELIFRLVDYPEQIPKRADDETFQSAVLWLSEYRFCSDGYQLQLPPWYSSPAIAQHPIFAAATLNGFLKLRYSWNNLKFANLPGRLREAAPTQTNPYYRHWFVSLADQFDEISSAEESRFNRFQDLFGADDDDDDDFDDDGLDYDPDCDCAACQAARKAAGIL